MKFLKFCFHIDHVGVVLLSFILLWILSFCVYSISFLDPVGKALDNFSISDVFFEIINTTTTPDTCELITLVDMTELHSRADIGQLMSTVNDLDPLCVGVDLIFEGEKDDILGNLVLESSVMDLDHPFVFSQKLTEYSAEDNEFKHAVQSYFVHHVPIQEGYTNMMDNLEHANIREFSLTQTLNDSMASSFPVEIMKQIAPNIIDLERNTLTINYKHTLVPSLKYDEVIEHPELIEGRIILIGTLEEEQDMHLTPIGKMPGMMIQAYSLLTLLEHTQVQQLPWYADILVCFIICWLLQLALSSINIVIDKHEESGIIYFCNEAHLFSGALLVTWLVIVNYFLFVMFIKCHISLDATMLLAMIAMTMEGREMYSAIITALSKKFDWKFIKNSISLKS